MAKYIIDSDLYVELLRTGRYHDIIAEIYTRETANIYFSSSDFETIKSARNFS